MGRDFEGQYDGSAVGGEARTLILSDSVWRTTYGNDPNILGKTVKLNGTSYVVIGVMPRAFAFPFGVANPLVLTPIVIGDDDAIRKRNKTINYQYVIEKWKRRSFRDLTCDFLVENRHRYL
jgi:putative ABC transport system permease protein